jgi:hypothetical protein
MLLSRRTLSSIFDADHLRTRAHRSRIDFEEEVTTKVGDKSPKATQKQAAQKQQAKQQAAGKQKKDAASDATKK